MKKRQLFIVQAVTVTFASVAVVLALSGCHVKHEAPASAQVQREPSNWEPTGTSEQVPWQMCKLQLQHDKSLAVEGRVLDADGKPLEDAHVAVISRLPLAHGPRRLPPEILGQATTDGSGAFRATMPSLPLHQVEELYAVARRAGYGMGIETLDEAVLRHEVTFHLEPELPVRGRVVGPDGGPAAGVQVHLRTILYGSWQEGPVPTRATFWPPARRPLPWPEPSTTDDEGRFVLQGIPRVAEPKVVLVLEIDDPRFAPFDWDLRIPSEMEEELCFVIRSDGSEEVTLQLEAPRFVEGTVICKDTKKPLAGAWLSVVSTKYINIPGDIMSFGVWVKGDGRGRFRARGRPGKYLTTYVYPPAGVPYPAWGESTEWPEGASQHEVTVEVPRGILVRGKVVEEESGAPVAGAGVEYQLCRDKETPYYDRDFADAIYWAAEYRKILTGDDGTFEIAVVPGPGHLMVKAPTPDFVSRYVTHGELQHDKPGGFCYVLEGLAKIDPKPGIETMDLTIPLRRGLTVRGRVVGPERDPVDKAALLTPAYARLGLYDDVWVRPVRDGRFELRGCDPAKPGRVYFLDAEHQWGATVDLDAAKAQREPPTVRLLPCGSATVRFVDQDGRPWANDPVDSLGAVVDLIFVKVPVNPPYLGPGDHLSWRMGSADRQRYRPLRGDADGRVTFPTLIPGAPYMLDLFPTTPEEIEEKRFYFSVQPGQNLDLEEIAIERSE